MSRNEKTGPGPLRLWRQSLQPEDPAGCKGSPGESRRRRHATLGTNGRPRPRGTLPRARSGPTSLTLAGRPGSLQGPRGREWREVRPRRLQIQFEDHDSGGKKNATKPRGRRTELLPGTRSRTGYPLTSARRQGKTRSLLFAPPRPSPFRGGRVSQSWAEDMTERRGKMGEQKEGKGGNVITSILCFQKRRNLSEEKNLKRKRK